jgi:hypothetical protein
LPLSTQNTRENLRCVPRAIEREAIMIGRCALRFAVTGKIILQNSGTNKFDPRQIETLWREDRRIRQSKKNTGRFSQANPPGQRLAHWPGAASGAARPKRAKACPRAGIPASGKQSYRYLRLSCRARSFARRKTKSA